MKYINILYVAVKIILVVAVLTICAIPIYYIINWLAKNNKVVKIHPKFEIVEVTNKKEIDINTTKEAIRISKEILEKIK